MVRKSIKIFCLLLVVVFSLGVFLSACGAGEKATGDKVGTTAGSDTKKEETKKLDVKKPKIRFASQYSGEEGSAKWIFDGFQKFAEENKDLAEFVYESEKGDNLRNKIKIDLAANNLPDAFTYWALPSLKAMIDADMILNVKEYVDKSKSVKWDMFPQDALDAYTYDGVNFYSIPTTGFKDFLLCNKELFQKFNLQYPKTYEDLLAVSKVFSENSIIPLAVGSKGGNPSHFLFAEIAYQFLSHEDMLKVTSGENKFNSPENVKTAGIILEMAKNKVFPKDPIGSGDFGPSVALYNDAKAAMVLTQSWMINQIKDEIVEKSEFITFPKFADAKYDPATFCVGGTNNGMAINKQSFNDPAKQEAIIAMMDYMASDEVYSYLAKDGAFIMKDVKIDSSMVKPLYTKVLDFTLKQKSQTNFWNLMPDPVSQEVISTTMDELWIQSLTAEQSCDKIQASIDKALKK